jgi:hypothetical protein
MPDIADILDRAADLIEPEGAWTQESYARDENGSGIADGRHANAVCWCGVGALEKAGGDLVGDALAKAIRAVLPKDCESFVVFNDTLGRTQAEVVAKLREAATLARTTSEGERG